MCSHRFANIYCEWFTKISRSASRRDQAEANQQQRLTTRIKRKEKKTIMYDEPHLAHAQCERLPSADSNNVERGNGKRRTLKNKIHRPQQRQMYMRTVCIFKIAKMLSDVCARERSHSHRQSITSQCRWPHWQGICVGINIHSITYIQTFPSFLSLSLSYTHWRKRLSSLRSLASNGKMGWKFLIYLFFMICFSGRPKWHTFEIVEWEQEPESFTSPTIALWPCAYVRCVREWARERAVI